MNSSHADIELQTELMHKSDTIWTAMPKADKEAIEQIINTDPNVINVRGPVGECPIHMRFSHATEFYMDIARHLITRFPHIVTEIYNQPRYYGENILHMVIINRNAMMVKWLLTDTNIQPYRQELLAASATGHFFPMDQAA
ncbi:unnamed protein product [Rotaria magnacalcarata]|uniref:Uncharacterized protein n=1 Tax=Rotaria magnacalcarata TaxID=392030 RepID=A0A816YKT2_9BILA|nr:unnamed protein product [Rotaria magnacalcarata]